MPSKEPELKKEVLIEEAQVNADLATAHAAKAIAQADAADLAVREATKEKDSDRLCPHCRAEMTQHGSENPYKAGTWHCDSCGCCFKGRSLRPGHDACKLAAVAAT